MLQKFIIIVVLAGLLAACNDPAGYLGSSSIANGAITVWRGEVTLKVDQAPAATIAKNGDFQVDGNAVAIDATQRQLFQHYYQAATALRRHGIDTGQAGAALAGNAVKGAVSSALHGDGAEVGKNVDAQADQVQQTAMKICRDLSDIKQAQDALASQLSAFKPYTDILTHADIKDCAT